MQIFLKARERKPHFLYTVGNDPARKSLFASLNHRKTELCRCALDHFGYCQKPFRGFWGVAVFHEKLWFYKSVITVFSLIDDGNAFGFRIAKDEELIFVFFEQHYSFFGRNGFDLIPA